MDDIPPDIYEEAVGIVLREGQGYTSVLIRRLGVGYSMARRMLEKMEIEGILEPSKNNLPRKVAPYLTS